MMMNYNRRVFLKISVACMTGISLLMNIKALWANQHKTSKIVNKKSSIKSDVYILRDGTPEENIHKLIDFLGGIESIFGKEDVVVVKPNSQWWNQGMTNTDSIIALIEMILAIPYYKGEVIIADNHQFQEDNSRGWITDNPNGRFNLNDVINYFHKKGHLNVTKYHWHDAGRNPDPLQGDAHGNTVVKGPQDGDGYVWDLNNYYVSENNEKCILTYPVFTSQYSGITIDMKNGAWQNGSYTGQPIKFINMSSLNHHSPYCGVTASVKNLMGVVDMSCGYPAPEPENTYNTHYIGLISPFFERLRRIGNIHWRVRKLVSKFLFTESDLIDFHFTGGVLGKWMMTVRKPDLNIITAEWIGYGSRIDINQSSHTRALVASVDALAADYCAAKYILLPETKKNLPESEKCLLNDPDNNDGPFRKFLIYANRETDGAIENSRINLIGDIT